MTSVRVFLWIRSDSKRRLEFSGDPLNSGTRETSLCTASRTWLPYFPMTKDAFTPTIHTSAPFSSRTQVLSAAKGVMLFRSHMPPAWGHSHEVNVLFFQLICTVPPLMRLAPEERL